MEQTGIKRRIDDLGRIVIPRDIREHFKIKAGDSFDIYVEDDSIVLQKFSPIDKQLTQLFYMCEVLSELIDARVIFYYDSDFIDPEMEYQVDSKPTTSFRHILEEYHPVSFNDEQLFADSTETKAGYTYPIIKEGNIIGVFIIFKQLAKLDDKHLAAIEFSEKYLMKVI